VSLLPGEVAVEEALQQGPEAGVESPQEEELLSLLDSNSLSGGRT
jgi:hypothetical protein